MNTKICLNTSLKRIRLKIRFYREAAQVSQKEAADKLNLGHRSYQRIESGEASCDISFIYKFCNMFEIDSNSMLSPSPPVINNNLHFFYSDDNHKELKDISQIREKICQDTNQKNISIGNLIDNPDFLNSEIGLCISTPFKQFFNYQAVRNLGLIKNKIKTMTTTRDIQEQINYWDCIYYYAPNLSIRNNYTVQINGEEIELDIHTTHFLQPDNIFNINTFKIL